jgi:hypothetical protein
MKPIQKIVVVWLVGGFLLLQAMPLAAAETEARAQKQDYGLAVVDLVATRPVGIGLTVLGLAAFVVSTPFTYFSDNTDDAWDKLVGLPARYTFVRPMGDL